MNEWQQRVVDEADELLQKLQALAMFRNSTVAEALSDDDKHLLVHQELVMQQYMLVLNQRIKRFG
jgi:hypothetical protein